MAYGLWHRVHGLWYMVHGIWYVLWHAVYGMFSLVCHYKDPTNQGFWTPSCPGPFEPEFRILVFMWSFGTPGERWVSGQARAMKSSSAQTGMARDGKQDGHAKSLVVKLITASRFLRKSLIRLLSQHPADCPEFQMRSNNFLHLLLSAWLFMCISQQCWRNSVRRMTTT